MDSIQIRKLFLDFFSKKEHKILPSASLIPQDATVLLTLAGMLPFKPIFMGEQKAIYPRVSSIQKCIRMNDLENVGNTYRHHTFFEMLGNFSFGDYFKEEAINFAWQFLTEVCQINKEKLLVSVHEADNLAYEIWQKKIGLSQEKIIKLGDEHNFWSAGDIGPCGPCSEIYYDFGSDFACKDPNCAPGCDCNRFLEIWNLVFMEYHRDKSGKLSNLPKKNIDTGMGLERIACVLQNKLSNFETDLFLPIISETKRIAKLTQEISKDKTKALWVIADHSRAIAHLLADGVIPSNEGRGYVLRRIIRRAIRSGHLLGIKETFLHHNIKLVIEMNKAIYPILLEKKDFILKIVKAEEFNFLKTLDLGLNVLEKMCKENAVDCFLLYDTYGFPLDLTENICQEKNITVDKEVFFKKMEQQKELAKQAGIKKTQKTMGGEIAVKDETEKERMSVHHSATHLLHRALEEVLGSHAKQAGSMVSPDKLRFDFPHYQALTDEERLKVEQIVNQKIKEKLPVEITEIAYEEAINSGAKAFLGEKYGDVVRVVKMGDFSTELCGGSHVCNTSEIAHFHICTESAIASGIRRIEAVAGQAYSDYLNQKKASLKSEFSKKQAKLKMIEEELAKISNLKKSFLQENIDSQNIESLEKGLNLINQAIKTAEKEYANLKAKQAIQNLENHLKLIVKKDELDFLILKLDLDSDTLKKLAEALWQKFNGVLFLASIFDNKIQFLAKASQLAINKGFFADKLVKLASSITGGGGGGRADNATAGGKDIEKIDLAILAVKNELNL